MVLLSLFIASLLLLINFVPTWLLISSNRYSYFQGILYAVLFIGIWFYKIQSEISLQDNLKMDLKESVYKSTNRSRTRMIRRFHDPWEYVAVDMNKIENELDSKRNFTALLLRILSIDSLLLFYMSYIGRKTYGSSSDYYRRNLRKYGILTLFCIGVEIMNYYVFGF